MSRFRSQEEFEAFLRRVSEQEPITRNSTVRVYGGPMSRNRTAFSRDQVEFTTDRTIESLDFIATTSCDFNHLLGSNGAELLGQCSVCRRWTCTTEGCGHTCVYGHVTCGAHAVRTRDGIYCVRHLPLFLSRKLAVGSVRLVGKALKAMWGKQ